MTEKNMWTACMLAGLSVLVLTGIIFPMFPQEMAIPNGIDSPVIAFEFARTQADLIAVFGEMDDPLRLERILAMDQGNRMDFAYMAAYSAFNALFFLNAYRKNGRRIWLLFAAIGLLAGVSDAIENTILFHITADLSAADGLAWLAYPVHLKFLSLYVCAFGVGYYLQASDRRAARLFGLLLKLLAPIAVILLAVGLASAATILITLAWLSQLVISVQEYRRSSQPQS